MSVCVNVKVSYIRPEYENLRKWMKDPENVYIGRAGIVFIDGERYPKKASIFANPYKLNKQGTNRDEVLKKYRKYVINQLETGEIDYKDFLNLRGKRLGCWCKPEPCHGDILIDLLDNYYIPYDKESQLRKTIKEYKNDPWVEPLKVKMLGDGSHQAAAYLGVNDMVKIVYKDKIEKENEAEYMRSLKHYKGIPPLLYEGDNYVITKNLGPIEVGQTIKEIIKMARQMINLIETLYNKGIYHNHLQYFTHTDGKQIYFIDNRLWEYVSEKPEGVTKDLLSMIKFLRRIADKNSMKFLNTLKEYIINSDRIADKLTFARLRGICHKYLKNV